MIRKKFGVFKSTDDAEEVQIPWEQVSVQAFRKPAMVQAVQLQFPFYISDGRGIKHGVAGDWVIRNEWGCLYLTTDLVFKQAFDVMPVSSDKEREAWMREKADVIRRKTPQESEVPIRFLTGPYRAKEITFENKQAVWRVYVELLEGGSSSEGVVNTPHPLSLGEAQELAHEIVTKGWCTVSGDGAHIYHYPLSRIRKVVVEVHP